MNAILVGHDSAVSTELAGTRGNAEAEAEALAGAVIKAAKAFYAKGTRAVRAALTLNHTEPGPEVPSVPNEPNNPKAE